MLSGRSVTSTVTSASWLLPMSALLALQGCAHAAARPPSMSPSERRPTVTTGTEAIETCSPRAGADAMLRVIVTDSTSTGVPGATVTVLESRTGQLWGSAMTANSGEAAFTHPAGENVTVVVGLLGFHTASASLYVPAKCATELHVQLAVMVIDASGDVRALPRVYGVSSRGHR